MRFDFSFGEILDDSSVVGEEGTWLEKERSNHNIPFAVVYTPIPVVSWICPLIGHLGICDSEGNMYDFSCPPGVSRSGGCVGLLLSDSLLLLPNLSGLVVQIFPSWLCLNHSVAGKVGISRGNHEIIYQ